MVCGRSLAGLTDACAACWYSIPVWCVVVTNEVVRDDSVVAAAASIACVRLQASMMAISSRVSMQDLP